MNVTPLEYRMATAEKAPRKDAIHAVYCLEKRVADAQLIGWKALEQSWAADLARVKEIVRKRGFLE